MSPVLKMGIGYLFFASVTCVRKYNYDCLNRIIPILKGMRNKMGIRRIFSLIGLFALCAFLFAACGNASAPTTSNNPTPTATTSSNATPTSSSDTGSGYNRYPTPTSTTSASGSTSGTIKTATATVGTKSETILTDAQGLTLYYFTPDTSTTSACTGGCASNWPPLLVTGSASPTSDTTLSGKLTTLTDANGTQVEYNGHLLYTFAGDSGPGQTKGQGVGGKWYVATPDLS
jgi:predicted lipoprotein with Yx(FWY)xxD motif